MSVNFFFFFFETFQLDIFIQEAGKSELTKLIIYGGTNSSQIESGKQNLALLAKAPITALPSLSV